MTAIELVKASFSHGWDTFLKRPFIVIVAMVIMFGISIISSSIAQATGQTADSSTAFIMNIFDFLVVQIIMSMGILAFFIKASDNIESAHLSQLWSPRPYWKFLGTSILITIIEFVGLILLVIPGIIAAVLLIFAPYFVMDRQMGPVEAMKMSFHVVKEHFWGIFLLLLVAIVINIVGTLLFGVGLLISVPVTLLAIAHAYRTLAGQVPQVV